MIAVICLFAGFAAGFFTASLCMAARRGDRMRPDGALTEIGGASPVF